MRATGGLRYALALVLGLALVGAGCTWTSLGFDATRTGFNPSETAISAANVSTLHEVWSATIGTGPTDQAAATWSPVVGSSTVIVGTNDGVLRAFDKQGVTGCSGMPKVCQPLWRANVGGAPLTPTIVGTTVYVTAGGTLYAFDAAGATNCSGTPRTCQPLWKASPTLDSPVVDRGTVYVSTGTTVAAFDAAGATGCAGTPRTCQPLWSTTAAGCAGVGTECRYSAPSVGNGKLYAAWAGNAGLGQASLQAFDAAGVTGCTGVPKRCSPLWDVFIRGNKPTPPPTIADGRVFVIANFVDTLSGNTPGAWIEAHDAATGALQWDSQNFGNFAYPPVVANGRLYLPAAHVRVFDATGVQGCGPNGPPRHCSGLFTLTANEYDVTAGIANGVLYTGSAPFFIEGTNLPAAVHAFPIASLSPTCNQFDACPPAWSTPDLGSTTSAPVVVDGAVYVAAAAGTLHAYRLP